MEELLQKIEEACAAYYSKELDDAGFQKVIDEIPAQVWQEKASALEVVKSLVENEDLYEVSLDKPCIFAEFICRLLPQGLFEKPDYVLWIAEIIYDFFRTFDEGPSCYDVDKVFSFAPQMIWEDDRFANNAANFVIDRAYLFSDLNCVSDVIPDSVWKSEDELVWLVRRLYNEDERNMNQLSLFPEKSWESAKVIFEILSCLQAALENDRGWGTVYCNFRGNNEDYLKNFLRYVPDHFKSDRDFILDLLTYDYFSDSFSAVYDWMAQCLWLDREFVLHVLKVDENAVVMVPDRLAADEPFRVGMEEILDIPWLKGIIPAKNQPQWMKDWKL